MRDLNVGFISLLLVQLEVGCEAQLEAGFDVLRWWSGMRVRCECVPGFVRGEVEECIPYKRGGRGNGRGAVECYAFWEGEGGGRESAGVWHSASIFFVGKEIIQGGRSCRMSR